MAPASPAWPAPPELPDLLPMVAQVGGVLGWGLLVIVLLVLGFALVSWVRRWVREDDAPAGGVGFSLSDLRQLHSHGKMTDAEYERAKAKMVASAKAATAKMPAPAGGRRAPGAAGGVTGAGGAQDLPPGAPPDDAARPPTGPVA